MPRSGFGSRKPAFIILIFKLVSSLIANKRLLLFQGVFRRQFCEELKKRKKENPKTAEFANETRTKFSKFNLALGHEISDEIPVSKIPEFL